MKKTAFITLLFLLLMAAPLESANIHLHFFESADSILTDERFQRYSFSALADEKITVVAYSLEADAIPMLTVFDTIGSTLVENPNDEALPVVAVQFTASENGIYTFLVSRQTDVGGLIRVMVFEGDPIEEDRTLQDTVDPLLPARAYLFAGDETDPVEVNISVIEDDDPDTPALQIYAARGTDIELPPLEERTTPIESVTWENTDPERLYTVNVRALPDPVASIKGYLSPWHQSGAPITFGVQIEEGGPVEEVIRPNCQAQIRETVQSYTGPNAEDYPPASLFQAGQAIEIVGTNGDFYLVVDPDSETGGSWIPMISIELVSALDSVDCSRVAEVDAPPVPEDEQSSSGGTGSQQTTTTTRPTATPTATTIPTSNNWCYDPAKWGDGRCESGSQEQKDWFWRCGYFMAEFERTNNPSLVPADCVSVLPPSPTPLPPVDDTSTTTTNPFPGSWSGCMGSTTWIVFATYSAPPGAVTIDLVTNYGTSSGPASGTITHDTGQSTTIPSILVTGYLVARDSFGAVIGTASLGSLPCP